MKIDLTKLVGFRIALPMPKIGGKGHPWEPIIKDGPDLPETPELPPLEQTQ